METTVSQVISGQALPTISQQHSSTNSKGRLQLSQRQRNDLEAFRQHFDSAEKLTRVFAPAMWGAMIAKRESCITSPCITLSQIDEVYGTQGLAKQIVRNQFVGVYSMCTAKEPYNTNSLEIAADLFIAKYGKQCSLYAMMMYFGNYITEYKSSFAQFDMQDILQQFGKKFLPWWNNQLEDPSDFKEPRHEVGITGKDALYQMLANRLQNGQTLDDIRNSNLFKLGFCKEDDLAEIQRIAIETF